MKIFCSILIAGHVLNIALLDAPTYKLLDAVIMVHGPFCGVFVYVFPILAGMLGILMATTEETKEEK